MPVGAQGGRVIKIGGKLPVNLLVGAYYNAVRPEFGSTWQLRTQVAFIFLRAARNPPVTLRSRMMAALAVTYTNRRKR